MKKILYLSIGLLCFLSLLLTIFESTLFFFHSPFGLEIIYPKAHSATWIYLLKQKYISFIELDIFNIYEKRHLLDVKRVFERLHTLWMVILTISLFSLLFLYLKDKKGFFLVLKQSFYLNYLFIIISIVLASNFLNIFELLHQLLFLHQSWIFPPNSILIKWFPLVYFQQFLGIILFCHFLIILLFYKIKRANSSLKKKLLF